MSTCLDDLNVTLQEIRDAVEAIPPIPGITWDTSPDIFFQQSSVVLVSGTQYKGVIDETGIVRIEALLTATSAGTVANALTINGLPAANLAGGLIGHVFVFTAGVPYLCSAFYSGSGAAGLYVSGLGQYGISPAITIAINDNFRVSLTYRLA